MSLHLQSLLAEIRRLESAVVDELAKEKSHLGYQIQNGRIKFEKAVLEGHAAIRSTLSHYFAQSSFSTILSAPVIYSIAIPLGILDLFLFFYQLICFRVYRIPRVKRRDYLVFDHFRLRYLNIIERVNCVYCSYANGLLAYACEIAARTEQYWCPIKHARPIMSPHSRYFKFLAFGDADGYARELMNLRRQF